MTYQEQLDSVQAALAKIEAGAQAYEIQTPTGARQVTLGNLTHYYAREKFLRKMVAKEARGGIRSRYGTPVS